MALIILVISEMSLWRHSRSTRSQRESSRIHALAPHSRTEHRTRSLVRPRSPRDTCGSLCHPYSLATLWLLRFLRRSCAWVDSRCNRQLLASAPRRTTAAVAPPPVRTCANRDRRTPSQREPRPPAGHPLIARAPRLARRLRPPSARTSAHAVVTASSRRTRRWCARQPDAAPAHHGPAYVPRTGLRATDRPTCHGIISTRRPKSQVSYRSHIGLISRL